MKCAAGTVRTMRATAVVILRLRWCVLCWYVLCGCAGVCLADVCLAGVCFAAALVCA